MSRVEITRSSSWAVSAGHPIAADAAADQLASGGNAVDAAIAAAAVQCVVEMPWCGIGGDTFVAVHTPDGEVVTLNGSGAAPISAAAGLGSDGRLPRFGPRSIAVPGTVDAWEMLAARFASRPLVDLLEPAVALAAEGFPLDERLTEALLGLGAGEDCIDLDRQLGGSRAAVGDLFRQPDLAVTLSLIARHGADVFYRGPLGRRIADTVAGLGGALNRADLARQRSTWQPSISVDVDDVTVHTQPPVSMGCLLLVQLHILDRFDSSSLAPGSPELADLLIRCKHAAFREVLPELGDPAFVEGRVEDFLSKATADRCAEHIRAATGWPGPMWGGDTLSPTGTDTTSLAVVDGDGMAVSLVHSLFNEFGSRVLVDGTGIILNDRLANLHRDDHHPNGLAGGKRPVHTLHSYVATRSTGELVAGATPGGRGQVQTNLQVLVNSIHLGDDIQTAVDRPRWVSGTPRRSPPDDTLYVEAEFPEHGRRHLEAQGHSVVTLPAASNDHFGNCTVVAVDADGTRFAAADRRRGSSARTA